MRSTLALLLLFCACVQGSSELGATRRHENDIGPVVLFPDATTLMFSAFLGKTGGDLASRVQLCYRPATAAFDELSAPDDVKETETNPADSCALGTGGWRKAAFSTESQRVFTYGDTLDRSKPLGYSAFDYRVEHLRATIDHLAPDTAYELRLLVDGAKFSNRTRVRTPPAPRSGDRARTFRFAALADLRSWDSDSVQLKVRDQLSRLADQGEADFAVLPGDLSNQSGTSGQYAENYFRVYEPLFARVPFYPIHGNHDLFESRSLGAVSKDGTDFFSMIDLPPNPEAEAIAHGSATGFRSFYSFDWGDTHFIALDVPDVDAPGFNQYDAGSPQYRWLEKDLERSKDARWRIAFFHRPIARPDERGAALNDLTALLKQGKVALAITGHWENPQLEVESPDGLPWVVVPSGGSRSALYERGAPCSFDRVGKFGLMAFEVSPELIRGRIINPDGKETGAFEIGRDENGAPQGRLIHFTPDGC